MPDPWIPARHYRRGRSRPVRLVVVHATQGGEGKAGTARRVARYFQTTDRPASTHAVCDAAETIRCVADEDTCYGAKGANADGLHVELCGRSEQSRGEWLDDVSRATIDRAARLTAAWCQRWQIPTLRLTVAQLRDGRTAGLTDHATVDTAFPSSGHWDPGPHFPWDVFLARVHSHSHRRTDLEEAPVPRPVQRVVAGKGDPQGVLWMLDEGAWRPITSLHVLSQLVAAGLVAGGSHHDLEAAIFDRWPQAANKPI